MSNFNHKIPLSPGYTPAPPRNHDLLYAPWMYNPIQSTLPTLTLTDVIGANYSSNGSVQLTLGYGNSGETVTKNAMLFSVPGIISIPLPTGTVTSSNGVFNPSTNSSESAQAVSYIRNDQWITLGLRDTRSQVLIFPALSAGETAVFCQSSKAVSYYRSTGDLVHYTSDGNNDATVALVPGTVNVIANSVILGDALNNVPLAYASVITNIKTAVSTAFGSITPSSTVVQVATAIQTFANAIAALSNFSTTKVTGV